MMRAGSGLLIALALMLAGCQSSDAWRDAKADGWNHFGGDVSASGPEVAIGSLGGDEVDVIVTGEITEVCAVKGCWMRVADDDGEELFVRFKDYGFFVPRNAAGQRVVMHGRSEKGLASVDELRHYAEDAGASPEEIAAITEPEMRVTFFADAIFVDGDDLDPPYSASG